jgi:hypothetical protein
MGLFGGKSRSANLQRLTETLQAKLGLTLVPPASEIVAAIDALAHADIAALDAITSVEGLQEILRTKSIRLVVDEPMHMAALFLFEREELERELTKERLHTRLLNIKPKVEPPLIRREEPRMPLPPTPAPVEPASGATVTERPEGLAHLEACEKMCPPLVDFLVKHGQLNSGDKEVLRQIKPAGTTWEARIAALERWQTEVARRLRAVQVAKVAQQVVLGGDKQTALTPRAAQEALVHRFEAVVIWISKLIKAVEATGYRYHDKPVWLPH